MGKQWNYVWFPSLFNLEHSSPSLCNYSEQEVNVSIKPGRNPRLQSIKKKYPLISPILISIPTSTPLFLFPPSPLSWSLAACRPLRAKGKQMAASLSNSTMLRHTCISMARSDSIPPPTSKQRHIQFCGCSTPAHMYQHGTKAHMSNQPCVCTADSWPHREKKTEMLYVHKHALS